VRELRNAVERGWINAKHKEGGSISPKDLGIDVGVTKATDHNRIYSLDWASAEYEFRRIYWKRVKEIAKGSKTKAGEISGFHRGTVDTHLKEIDKQEKVEHAVERYLESLPKNKRDERLEASKKALLEREDRKLIEDDLTEEQWRDIATAHLRRQVANELNLKSADE
jgi:cytochrome oxidase assembly protein ShyY1